MDRASEGGPGSYHPILLRMPPPEEPSPHRLRAWLTWATVTTLGLIVVLYAVARWWR